MTTETATAAYPEKMVDTGPLSWLMNEIRDALTRSANALEELARDDLLGKAAGTKQLQVTKTYLHQAHGALQMVDITGVTTLTEAAQLLIEKVEAGRLTLSVAHVQTIRTAYQALCEHLEELLAGRPNRPVRLYPYYQDLMEIQGLDRAHPSDLYFPVMALHRADLLPPQQMADDNDEPSQRYARLRQRFEPGLLAFMKASDMDAERASAEKLVPVMADVYDMQSDNGSRAFWWTMVVLLQSVASGNVIGDRFVKQLFGKINIQLRQMGHGDLRRTERLQRDALFLLASTPQVSPGIISLRQAFSLNSVEYDEYAQRHYGKIDIDLLRLARDRMQQVKGSWEHITSSDYAPFENFVGELDALALTIRQLQPDQLQRLTDVLCNIVRRFVADNARDRLTGSDLGLEVARALLFVESTLQNIYHLPDGYLEQININCERLNALAEGETVVHAGDRDIYQGARDKQLMRTLVHELVATLRQVEKQLDDYFLDPAQRGSLPGIDKSLHQIEGVLSIQDRHDAIEVVQLVRRELRQLGDMPTDQQPDEGLFSRIARNVGGLSFYIEALGGNDGQTASFTFDAEKGVYHVNMLQSQVAPVVSVPEEPIDAGVEQPQDTATSYSTETEPVVAAESAMQAAPAAPVTALVTVNIDDIDPELLDIFLGEAQEVLDGLVELIPRASAMPNDQEMMAVLRRSFHTLKGSSRMVGLNQFGEAAWQIERVMNAWVADGRAGTPELYVLLNASTQYLRNWVEHLRLGAVPERSLDAIMALAAAMLAGQHLDHALLDVLRVPLPETAASSQEDSAELPSAPLAFENTLDSEFDKFDELGQLDEFEEDDGDAIPLMPLHELPPLDLHYELPDMSFLDEPVVSEGVDEADVQNDQADDTPSAVVNFDDIALMPVNLSYDGFDLPTLPETDVLPELLAGDVESNLGNEAEFAVSPEDELSTPAPAPLSDVPELSEEIDIPPEAVVAPLSFLAVVESMESAAAVPPVEVSAPETSETEAIAVFGEPLELLESAEQDALAEMGVVPAVHDDGQSDRATIEPVDDGMVKVGSLSISQPLYNIYMAETEQLVSLLSQDFEEWRLEPKREVAMASITAAHSLAGSSATVGFMALQELAHALELVLQCKTEYPAAMRDADHEKLVRVVGRARWMLERFAHGEVPDHEPVLVATLTDLRRALEGRKAFSNNETRDFGPVSLIPLSELNLGTQAIDDSAPLLPRTEFGMIQMVGADAGVDSDSRAARDNQTDSDTSHIPMRATDMVAPTPVPVDPTSVTVGHFVDTSAAGSASSPLSKLASAEGVKLDGLALRDDLDADLLPVFVEEGQIILPEIATALRGWQQHPEDPQPAQGILRHLHTIKGSARMAGAMRFGQHMHDMETLVGLILRNGKPSADMLDDLLTHFDGGMQMFDALQKPPTVEIPVTPVDQSMPAGTDAPAVVRAIAPNLNVLEPRSVPHIRVNADVLDRLSNQTGEVAIVRTRLDSGIENLRTSLSEMSENIERLRGQLRELDIQAESQISARMTNPGERDFDPLEFDRFTRLQELTRIIAETISDVGTVQKNLVSTVSAADTDLIAQSRLTRELQQELMRVRMVPFGSVSERLYRLTRQVSKETGKRVNLDIVGVTTEIDRGVLEKITAPIEHLLRNSIVHGIEPVEERRNQSKPEVGQLKLDIRQEGNEIFIRLSDDGRGLNLEAIEQKARSQNLVAAGSYLAPEEIADLIFLPGFSTADSVTELAGRGVGMDVVRAEANLLGGRVTTASQFGKGTQFTVQLPLTLAVLQVVLIKAGERTHSIPSGMVMQVLQVPATQMEAIYATREIEWQHRTIPVLHLSTLLGSEAPIAVRAQTQVMILKNDTEFVAVAVDEVLGNREVVIKNTGPQLSRMTGIAGATVLGNGDIILILNPVPLVLRAMKGQSGSITVSASSASAEAAARLGAQSSGLSQTGSSSPVIPSTPSPAPVRRQIRVMVVDDSLTVRRVTQRLLEREGFGVILAKDGLDALQQLQGDRPDVMLIDIEMPRMDGFDLTRNVRHGEKTKDIPIIVITSRNAEKHRNVAVELGANEYLGKPYQEDQLLQAIESVLSKASVG